MTIDNGRNTLFWNHCWGSDDSLRQLALSPISAEIERNIIEEMWERGVGWRLGFVRSHTLSSYYQKYCCIETN